jgi:hypothetical protein
LMEILFTKTGKEEHVFSCKRKDGTITWKHGSNFFILHDLCHFVVEKELPLRNAFLGMVAAGTDIEEFDLPKEQRKIDLTAEAIFAEHLINLLVIDYMQGRMENLIEIFTSIHDEHLNSDILHLVTEEQLETIRIKYAELMKQWNLLPAGQTLLLLFEE